MLKAALIALLLFATTARADFIFRVDDHPKRISHTEWAFKIHVKAIPVALQFACAQYNFAWATPWLQVEYPDDAEYFESPYGFLAISTTLYNPIDGYLQGWDDITDPDDSTFTGIVTTTAPLTSVYFEMDADTFVRKRHK